jgi:hypothetical protein
MTLRRLSAFLAALAAAAGAASGHAHAGGPAMALGAAEDVVRAPDLPTAQAKMAQLRLAGFSAVRITSNWLPGLVAPTEDELRQLRNVEAAAELNGVTVYVSVYHPGQRTTPLEPAAQAQFAQYAAAIARELPSFDDVIVGNEPNLNRFWLPQFAPDGSNASAPAYLSLLAQTYDALKAVDPTLTVWGGALAPRGSDRPGGRRPTSSPTAFIQAMGVAYRASGRAVPVMDGLAIHPYPDHSSQSPDVPHPRSTSIGLADYDKLVGLLGQAFDGTAQPGSSLPILYDEFGIESVVPAGKRSLYTGSEPRTTRPVDERRQVASYALGLRLAFCQPTVAGILLFHSHDEQALLSWQSGVYYADGTPKSSLWAVRDALARTRGGSIGRCEGMALEVSPLGLRFPAPRAFPRGVRSVRFRCTLDCKWTLDAVRAATGAVAASVRGYGRADRQLVASLGKRRLGASPLRLRLTLVHPVNPGSATTVESGVLRPA